MADWTLAIDFGTTSSSAAIANGGLELVEVAGAPRVPSAVLAADDGTLVAGDIALRQGSGAPDRMERTPKRRIGDRVVVLGEQHYAPAELAAAVLRLLADEAIRRQGGQAPSEVRLTHPASWAGTRLGVLREAAERAGLGPVSFVPEPVAAALHYADEQLPLGALVAVYDLGGGTFDTAVLRRTEAGFEVVGPPGGSDRLGGEDFDERLYQHVGAALAAQDGEAWEQLRYSQDRPWVRANASLRSEVRAAKEALSTTADYTIYVPAPVDAEVRVTREELERLIAGDLERTIDELAATVDRAGVALDDLAAVYLVGGSSRIPLITRLLADRLGRMPVTWGDPKAVVVLGAAAAAPGALLAAAVAPAPSGDDETAVLGGAAAASPADPVDPTLVTDLPTDVDAGPDANAEDDRSAPVTAATTADTAAAGVVLPLADDDSPPPARRPLLLAGAAAALVVLLVAAVLIFGDDTDGGVAAEGGSPDATTTTELDPDAEPLDLVRSFDPEGDSELVAQRTFRFSDDGTEFRNDTVLRNATAGPITRIWFEVVPKELATTVAAVTWSIQPTGVVVDDPVVYFEVELAAGADLTVTWSTPLPTGEEPSAELLDELAAAHAVAVGEAANPIALATAILADEGAEVVDPQVPDGGSTTETATGGTTDGGGSGGSGGSGGTTGTTSAPRQTTTTTTKPTTTTAAPITAPSSPRNAAAQNPVAVSINGQNGQGTMRITVSWQAPSNNGGQTPTYRVTWTQMGNSCPGNNTAVNSGSVTTSSTSVTFDMVNATTNPCSYVRYQVVAVNSGGTSAAATASGTVPNILGKQHAYHLVRAASGRAVNGGPDMDCGQPAYAGCQTNPASGTFTAGTNVGVRVQQE